MSHDPTSEQQNIIDAFLTEENLVIEAGAGTGKTTTLRLMAEATQNKGIYIAYNKAIADDAKASFPRNVKCGTAHSLAFRTHALPYKDRLFGPRVTGKENARILGIHAAFPVGETALSPVNFSRVALNTVNNFCNSSDDTIQAHHVPKTKGLEQHHAEIVTAALPYARKAWEDIKNPNGRLKFNHDHYLKMWALDKPKLQGSFVLLDEAQDANPVIAKVVADQTHMQRIMVGDQSQAIYGWRGAVDAMENFEGKRLRLTQSFRFGHAVATEANKWLTLLEAPLRLQGFEKIETKIEVLTDPSAILCRTNAETMSQAMFAIEAGRKVAIVGGTHQIKSLAEAAIDLMASKTPYHPDLVAFSNWAELVEYVNDDEAGRDLKVFVKLVEEHGPQKIIEIANACVSEEKADVILSTAHKAKGREWDRVKIADDFNAPKDGEEPSRSEMMLLYVSVTRARQALDNSSIKWVDGLLSSSAHGPSQSGSDTPDSADDHS